MIRIFCISRINLLSGRTNVYNLTKTCEALNAVPDFFVKLVTTDQDRGTSDFFKKVGVTRPFDVVTLGVTNTISRWSGRGWYEFLMLIYANFCLVLFLLKRRKEFDVVYFRDDSVFFTVLFARFILRKKIFFEVHSVLERWYRQMRNVISARVSHGVIAISGGLRNFYQKINNNTLLSLCSAAEDVWFDHKKSKTEFRKELEIPNDRFILGYTGVVGLNPNDDYYELDDVIKGLRLLPQKITCVIVGEINGNAQWLRDIAIQAGVEGRVTFVPWQERRVIPKYLQAFDVILIPKRKKDLVGDSPAKMFPALASGRPIVAGRAECIEEVLTDEFDSLIIKENNPQGWADAIQKVYNDQKLSKNISDQALKTSSKYTWAKRGLSIAGFIKESFK